MDFLAILDEPTGNLDSHTAEEIIEVFKELAHVYNKCVIVVTHEEGFRLIKIRFSFDNTKRQGLMSLPL